MNYLRTLPIFLGVLGLSSLAHADGIPTTFPASVCGKPFDSADQLAKKTAGFVKQMQVDLSQGDIGDMGQQYNDFYTGFAGQCDQGPTSPPGPVFREVCGYDCHVLLAQFHLFMSSDIAYFAAKGGDPLAQQLTPAAMANEVNEGIRIVESGLTLLGSGTSASTPDGLNGYLRQVGALNILRAKLYMAQGDAFYQNISEARIERLAYLANTALDQDPTAKTNMTKLAKAGYDAALWGLNEALLEIPADATFTSLYLEAQALVTELKARRASLKAGLLFVGIDPDAYTLVNVADEKTRLLAMAGSVTQLEGQVENVVKTYQSLKSNIQLANDNNTDALNNQSISVSTYRAGVIENKASQDQATLQAALDKVNAATSDYDRQTNSVNALFTMKTQAMEAENRLAGLLGARQVEVITYQRDQVVQQINDLQWLMNQEVSKTNLQLQVDGLEASYVNMDRDVAKAKDTQAQQDNLILQANNQITSAQANIDKDNIDIAARQAQSGPIFDATTHGSAAAICQVENKLARLKPSAITQPFSWTEKAWTPNPVAMTCANVATQVAPLDPTLGTQQDYINRRCKMKAVASQQKIESTADFLICIVGKDGVSALPQSVQDSLNSYLGSAFPQTPNVASYSAANCGAFQANCDNVPDAQGISCQGTYAAMKAAYGEKMKLAQTQIDAMQGYISELEGYSDWVTTEVTTMSALTAAEEVVWGVQQAALDAAKAATAGIPRMAIGVAGMAGPITLDYSIWEIPQAEADAAYQSAKDVHDGLLRAQSLANFVFTQTEKIREVRNQITKLHNDYDTLKIQQTMQKFETAQAIMEITGKSLDLASQLQAGVAQQQLDVVDCTNSVTELDSEFAQLQFQHDSLVSQLSAAKQQNDLVPGAIASIALSRSQEQLSQDNSRLTIKNATIEKQKAQEDIDAIEGNATVIGIRQRTKEQEATLKALMGQLGAQADVVAQQQALKNTLASQIFQTSLANGDTNIKYVQDLINTQTSHTDAVVTLLGSAAASAFQGTQIKAEMDTAYGSLQKELGVEKQNMLSTAEKMYDHIATNPSQQIYLSNDQIVASLTKGIPEYLQEKRRLLQTANFELALLYNKVNALHSTVQANVGIGLASGNADPISFVKTGDDLTQAVAGFDNTMFQNQAIVQAETVAIQIPAASGLARQLASELTAEFEISPVAANGKMAENGYFVLWHDAFNAAQAFTVLDMNMFVGTMQAGCQRQQFHLYHEGSGFRFYAPGGGAIEPLFFTGAERRHDPKYYTNPDGTQSEFHNAWNPVFSLFGFWMGKYSLPYDTGAVLPLLGTPVIGTYRVKLDPAVQVIGTDAPNACTYDGATFQLLIAYSKITQ